MAPPKITPRTDSEMKKLKALRKKLGRSPTQEEQTKHLKGSTPKTKSKLPKAPRKKPEVKVPRLKGKQDGKKLMNANPPKPDEVSPKTAKKIRDNPKFAQKAADAKSLQQEGRVGRVNSKTTMPGNLGKPKVKVTADIAPKQGAAKRSIEARKTTPPTPPKQAPETFVSKAKKDMAGKAKPTPKDINFNQSEGSKMKVGAKTLAKQVGRLAGPVALAYPLIDKALTQGGLPTSEGGKKRNTVAKVGVDTKASFYAHSKSNRNQEGKPTRYKPEKATRKSQAGNDQVGTKDQIKKSGSANSTAKRLIPTNVAEVPAPKNRVPSLRVVGNITAQSDLGRPSVKEKKAAPKATKAPKRLVPNISGEKNVSLKKKKGPYEDLDMFNRIANRGE